MKRRITVLLGFALAVTLPSAPAVAAASGVILDQAYVADLHPVDPHAGSTAGLLHVSVTAGQQTAHTLVHLGRNDVSRLVFAATQDPADNTGTPALQACPIVGSYPERVDPANPPAYDCASWLTPGVRDDHGSWSFDLNGRKATGVAVVAKAPAVTDSWSVAFDPKATVAAFEVVIQPPAPGTTAVSPAAPASTALPPVPATAVLPPLPAPPTVGAPAPAPSVAAAPLTVTPAATTTRDRVPAWVWIVLVLLTATCVALAAALMQARRRTPDRDAALSTLVAWRTLRESPALTAATSVILLAAFIGSGFVGNNDPEPLSPSAGPVADGSAPGTVLPSPGAVVPGPRAATSGPTTVTQRPSSGQPGSINHPLPSGGTSKAPRVCRWSCDIAYQGNGTTPFGPAPKPKAGNGGSTAVGVTSDTIRIGVIGTGGSADFNGADATQGLKAFINKINQDEGGIYGRKIVLDYYSTNNDTAEGGVAAARQVIARDLGAVIINGVDGADSAGQVLGQAGVPFLSSQSSHKALASQASVFTVTSPVEDHARGLVAFMANRLRAGPKICFFVTNTNLWRSAVIPALRSEAKKRGVTIPVIAETQYTQTSFTAQLKQMQDSGCTGVGMFTVLEQVGIVRDAKTLNYKPTFSADEWTFDVLVQGQYGNAGPFSGMKVLRLIGTADEPGFADYFRDSAKYTGDDGLPDAAVHYAIAQLAVEGMKRAGPRLTRSTAVQGLLTLRAFSTKGILDKITYTAGDRAGNHTVYTAVCCSTASDGTTRWKKLDGWRHYASF